MTAIQQNSDDDLSPRWKVAVVLTLMIGFTVLIWIAFRAYEDAPPIPDRVVGPSGKLIFTGEEITAGQQVFLRYGLMENGTIWGHGAYLGPDFSAQYLHTLGLDAISKRAWDRYGRGPETLTEAERDSVSGDVIRSLKMNRYDPETSTLTFTDFEISSFQNQVKIWTDYFSRPEDNGGLPADYISDPEALRQLTAFFAWAAWASIADRPDKSYSYTNNFP